MGDVTSPERFEKRVLQAAATRRTYDGEGRVTPSERFSHKIAMNQTTYFMTELSARETAIEYGSMLIDRLPHEAEILSFIEEQRGSDMTSRLFIKVPARLALHLDHRYTQLAPNAVLETVLQEADGAEIHKVAYPCTLDEGMDAMRELYNKTRLEQYLSYVVNSTPPHVRSRVQNPVRSETTLKAGQYLAACIGTS